MSADQAAILESIRDIIAGNPPAADAAPAASADDEILDLTQMLNADGTVTELKPKAKKKPEPKPEPVAEVKVAPKPEPKPEPKLEPKVEPIVQKAPVKEPAVESGDILSEIDALLAGDTKPVPKKEAPKAEENDLIIELSEIDKRQAELAQKIKAEPNVIQDIPLEELKPMEAVKPLEEFVPEPVVEAKPEPVPEPARIVQAAPEPEITPVEEFSQINLKEEAINMSDVVSDTSISAAKSSIANLMSKLDETKKSAPAFKSGETVEEIVAEMLKPMMKDWLDNNLPKLVNQIVEREIAKIMSNR